MLPYPPFPEQPVGWVGWGLTAVMNDKMLNAQPAFLDILAALARQALEFKGDIWWLNR